MSKHPAQNLVIEFYLAIERAEGKGSVDRARAAARAAGATFSNPQSAIWLAPFTKAAAEKRTENGVSNGVGFTSETAGSAAEKRTENGLARDKVIPTLPGLEPKGSSDTPVSRTPAQKRLKLRTPAEIVADEALKILEPLVRPHAVSVSWTAWKQRNRQTAVRMAETMSAEDIAALYDRWRTANDREFGMLRWAVEWSQRGSKPRGASQGPPGTIPFVCDDGTVIYGNPNDPVPLSELAAG